ncbi:NAD-dependent succinate-semialdehyde dehydrogenase [Martelella radicis]|uniref:Succinate-semialdehyde dehydrogenase/glutarate-semialdehyde dehydrogenase n=1 Tax=Martelella radicis TaxID=1397476 RepID=A0A7W6PAL9_9HYPH|nr:NAD-dependent succinate-semialdehyde dehydrogenase [Martelella radicis]MBB4122995.1 succinate-semialdehyde dehydrogenase/glutarate-semialdehyde dehydrogenase [Martelella radicis]
MAISQLLTDRLKDKSLARSGAFVAGAWTETATGGKTFDVTNPATGEVIATLPDCDREDVDKAIDAAHAAQKSWAKRTGKERAAVLRKLYDLMVANADDLATILTVEMGKPWAEARGEILYGAAYVEWFGEEAKRAYGDIIPGHQADKRIMVIRQPVGVVGAITPWNFPNAMLARKMAPALAAGCSIISKPAQLTPLSALALAYLAEQAGLPAGLFSVVTATSSSMVGKAFSEDDRVRKITFTGSTEVGRILMRQGADQIKKLGLELGGNAPFMVFDDADLDAAVEGAIASKYRNAGQTCVCANRLYVQSGVYDAFAEKLAKRVEGLKVGDGMAEGMDIGPMIDENAVEKVQDHIQDAVSKGAEITLGGGRHEKGGLFFQPTVLTGVTPEMKCAREETFGPVAPLFRFEIEEDVIRMANDTEFGLASYFFSSDVAKIFRVAEALEYGIVGVNTGLISTEVAPFGGVKQSGLGREGSKYGLDDYTELKYICLGGIA